MVGLPKFFTHTSDGLYDRHHYRVTLIDGSSMTFTNWEDTKFTWFNLSSEFTSHIDVIDKPTKAKGFK